MTTFQLFQSSGQHWYRLRADNGGIVQSSEGYTSKAACENGIQRVKANCHPQCCESFRESGQHGFNHVAANGEIIGRSGKYPAEPASPRARKPVSSASHSQHRDVSVSESVDPWGEAGSRNGDRNGVGTAGERSGPKRELPSGRPGRCVGERGVKVAVQSAFVKTFEHEGTIVEAGGGIK